ncbi:DUF4230 domain-containing protein [Psychrobacter sp. I-STPA10]|uniref:DUF4230 domain-containing protein n=1 Tax=Psychrobacter sp. I-STPA10 TaxID=2585769 RepID=UPI001E5FBDB2|nr:DUF4230 domain-containing protein [Psychrobacter sp. I-STPA10]
MTNTSKNLNNTPLSDTKPSADQPMSLGKMVLLLLGLMLLLFIFISKQPPTDEIEVLTREGVVTQIQSLNRLQTTAFSVDTIISSKKQGNWYALWQDEQKGLFVAHGRVTAGIDLNKLSASNVQVSEDGKNIDITLPSAEVFEVYLDNIEVYDIDTGVFGLVNIDPKIFNQAQIAGKKQVLAMACRGGMMQMASDNAKKQVQGLFELTGATVTVHALSDGRCIKR